MSNELFSLDNKVAIVTGASKGIGEAIARGLAQAGAAVVVSSRKQDAVDEVAQAITGEGGRALGVAAHMGEPEQVERLVDRTVMEFGGVDILVNNAAINPVFGLTIDADMGVVQKMLDVNVKGYLLAIQKCVPSMRARGGGSIINMASVAGLNPGAGMGMYSITKAAVIMMTRVLARELGVDKIRVNAVAPGVIKTKFSTMLWDTPEIYERVTSEAALKRIGVPDELIGTALYLASDAASFTTGATIVVDGGAN
ncbi:MAG: glucose 1-dehydrogenase [Chloroflexi bacterium]|nr:glucose 1-dehydrogenase [Chloroflexota bacterium]